MVAIKVAILLDASVVPSCAYGPAEHRAVAYAIRADRASTRLVVDTITPAWPSVRSASRSFAFYGRVKSSWRSAAEKGVGWAIVAVASALIIE